MSSPHSFCWALTLEAGPSLFMQGPHPRVCVAVTLMGGATDLCASGFPCCLPTPIWADHQSSLDSDSLFVLVDLPGRLPTALCLEFGPHMRLTDQTCHRAVCILTRCCSCCLSADYKSRSECLFALLFRDLCTSRLACR